MNFFPPEVFCPRSVGRGEPLAAIFRDRFGSVDFSTAEFLLVSHGKA